jgi:hypothetical protein
MVVVAFLQLLQIHVLLSITKMFLKFALVKNEEYGQTLCI